MLAAHLLGGGADPRGSAEDGAVEVGDFGALAVHHWAEPREKLDAARVLVRRIVFREVVAKRPDRERAGERVDDRVGDHISVGVRVESVGKVGELNPAEHRRTAGIQAVDVIAPADANHEQRVGYPHDHPLAAQPATEGIRDSSLRASGLTADRRRWRLGTFTNVPALRSWAKVDQGVVSLPNERLRQAISDSGLRLDDVAAEVGIDVKTAERWITKNRVPHPANRASVARLLSVDEVDLWPQLADAAAQAATDAELLRVYPHRGAVPAGQWYDLIGSAREHIDVLVYSGLFLADGRPDLPDLLQCKASEGVQVRLVYGDPDSDAVALRGSEEGIGDGLAARVRLSLSYIEPALDAPNVRMRLHDTTLYNSIYRYDDEMLVNTHIYGVGAGHAPVMHLRRTPLRPAVRAVHGQL